MPKNFKLYAICAKEFWKSYDKTKLKYTDEDGSFGFVGYGYNVYSNKKGSKCILVCTYQRILSMRRQKELQDVLNRAGLDIDEVVEGGKVIIARETT